MSSVCNVVANEEVLEWTSLHYFPIFPLPLF